MNQKLVSIIIPLYNAEKYISETLESVLSQTYPNWECIIVDDGSTDSSKEVVGLYCKKDMRFKYHYQDNQGASAARNKGIDISNGQYIQYLDADDLILPDKIRYMVEESEKGIEKVIYYSNMILGKENNIYEEVPLNFSLNLGSDITFDLAYRRYALDFGITPACFLFLKKDVEFARWDVNLGPAEDWDYLLQILINNYKFRFLSETFVIYRNTSASYSKNITKSLKAHYRVLIHWAFKKNSNLFHFSKRAAMLFQESIVYRVLRKTNKIIYPDYSGIKISLKQYFFIFLIYPLTILYLVSTLSKVIIKRIKKLK